jgi:hypothetical protein
VIFETARLIVRHLGADDLDALVAVCGDADAMHWRASAAAPGGP